MECVRAVLLVDDDKVDQMSVKRAFKDLNIKNPLEIAQNGEEALASLEKNIPHIILLDLNMPKMNGIEFLKIVKSNEKFKLIPIIVLTTSKEQQDKIDSFNFGVSGFMVKPVDYKKFVEIIKSINLYWTLSEVPD